MLHLHGCVYLDTRRFQVPPMQPGRISYITRLKDPKFRFDPGNASRVFLPWGKGDGYAQEQDWERVIAPVRNKAQALVREFITEMYNQAGRLVATAPILVAVGYRFGKHDRCSYAALLEAAQARKVPLLVVAPDADEIADELREAYPELFVDPCPCGFATWVRSGYPGLEDR